jgi:acetyl esterase/lipase
MPRDFLIASIVGLLFVLNARRALRFQIVVVPAFFASWLVTELAPQLLVLEVLGVAAFVIEGGAKTWPGWLALAISALTAAVLAGFVRESERVAKRFDEVLTPAIGAEIESREPVAWRQWANPFKLWSRDVRRERDIPYAPPGTRRFRLDVWHTADGRTNRPCFLYIPGGAWVVGVSNKNHQAKPLLMEMASSGWVCFAMNYPVAPRSKFPAHIIAVKRAIAWVKEHAHEYGGDRNFILISGNSAGGHLSSLAALTPNDPEYQPGFEDKDTTVQAAAPFYGVYDWTGAQLGELSRRLRRYKKGMLRFLQFTVSGRRLSRDREFFEHASPWFRVNPDAPPFLVIHGAHDTLALVEEARGFVERLRAVSNQPVIYVELPRTQHAFDHFLSIRTLYAVRAISRFGAWALSAAHRGQPSAQALRSPTSPT